MRVLPQGRQQSFPHQNDFLISFEHRERFQIHNFVLKVRIFVVT